MDEIKKIQYEVIVGFTGRRNMKANESDLYTIWREFHAHAHFVHGGAKRGFDWQVDKFLTDHGTFPEVIEPDYATFGPNAAPKVRNTLIVNRVAQATRQRILYALWEGYGKTGAAFKAAKHGGTWDTIEKTQALNKQMGYELIEIRYLEPAGIIVGSW